MTSHYRHRRIFDAATAFPSPIEPGEIAVNSANRQIAVGDANPASPGAIKPLLAVRIFDVNAQYASGEFVVQAGNLYRSTTNVIPGAFNPSQWDLFSTNTDAKAYVDAGDAALAADIQTAVDQGAAAVNTKVDRAGDTMTGALNVPLTPNTPTEATSKKYVDDQIAAGGIVTIPALNVTYAPTGNVSATNVQAAITQLDAAKAPIYSPSFQGVPVAPTPLAGDNSTKLATTAWVQNYTVPYVTSYVAGQFTSNAGISPPLMDGVATIGISTLYARDDHRHPTDTTLAPKNSPALTGVPTTSPPSASSNSTQIATTAFVVSKIAGVGGAPIDSPVFTGNPQAPTPTPGDNDTSLATTAFVSAAIIAAGAATIATPVQYILGTTTITVPAGAHKCEVMLLGGGGSGAGQVGGGGGGALLKLLTGLTPGLTMGLTIGAGGTYAPTFGNPGGATTLTSGSQSVPTLTAGGGVPQTAGVVGGGGTATGGDVNFAGGDPYGPNADLIYPNGGDPALGYGHGQASGGAAKGYGAGGGVIANPGLPTASGTQGLAILRWYA